MRLAPPKPTLAVGFFISKKADPRRWRTPCCWRPWHVDLGIAPSLSGTSFGNGAGRSTVVGVTSWGYTDTTIKQHGASSFTSGNIAPLVNFVCSETPGAC